MPGTAAAPDPPRLAAIWIKRAKLGPMDPTPLAELVAGRGLVGNADQGLRRQVTVIDLAAWRAALAELGGAELHPSARRANLLLEGLELAASRGRVLAIGDCRLRVLGETRPCERMERALPGLKAALEPAWRGGVFCEVVVGGTLRVGAPARWAETAAG
jgi:MOSC domain-containing protein YiiM